MVSQLDQALVSVRTVFISYNFKKRPSLFITKEFLREQVPEV